jgi:protein ImuB
MRKRFVSIWFRHLQTDWHIIRQPSLQQQPFVVAVKDHGRQIVTAASAAAENEGIVPGTVVADARAVHPSLQVFDEKPGRKERLLQGLGEWAIRYTPLVSVDAPDGLLLDASGCAHLWGGERAYLKDMITRLRAAGYDVRAAMADTAGAAWAVARYGKITPLIESEAQAAALLPLPPEALRLDAGILERLHKLGLHQIGNFINMPRPVLRRRFGESLLQRLAQALGQEEEALPPIQLVPPYEERLPCLEPVSTLQGIEAAIQRLLEQLCGRLKNEGKGIRTAVLQYFRVDGIMPQLEVGTSRPSHNAPHLFGLFALKIASIAPGMGIEVFVLQATKVEDVDTIQEKLWIETAGLQAAQVAELLDRVAGKVGAGAIRRYLPDQHYWPERSFKPAASLAEKPTLPWPENRPRPVQVLHQPEQIDVTAPIPDYPPMNFRYKGQLHEIRKADGPERIEREWWLEEGAHRDYYIVEDQEGRRYWVFRLGHYSGNKANQWFIHGFFA